MFERLVTYNFDSRNVLFSSRFSPLSALQCTVNCCNFLFFLFFFFLNDLAGMSVLLHVPVVVDYSLYYCISIMLYVIFNVCSLTM